MFFLFLLMASVARHAVDNTLLQLKCAVVWNSTTTIKWSQIPETSQGCLRVEGLAVQWNLAVFVLEIQHVLPACSDSVVPVSVAVLACAPCPDLPICS